MTDEEYKALCYHIGEWIKDLVFMKSTETADEVLTALFNEGNIDQEDKLTFNYSITMVGNDIISVLGKIRRQAGAPIK